MSLGGKRSPGSRSNKGSKQRQVGSYQCQVASLILKAFVSLKPIILLDFGLFLHAVCNRGRVPVIDIKGKLYRWGSGRGGYVMTKMDIVINRLFNITDGCMGSLQNVHQKLFLVPCITCP